MNTEKKEVPNMEEFKEFLKRHGMKATSQRLAVHKAMMSLGHASVDMVADYISKNSNVNITSASIYNILSQLTDEGLYKSRLSANSKMYFDVNHSNHIHLYDTATNSFKDIFDDKLMNMVEEHLKRKKFKGYKVDGIEIQIICHSKPEKAVQ